MPLTDRNRLLVLARRQGIVTASDAASVGIHSQELTRLVRERVVQRISRGQYRLANFPVTEHHGLVMAARTVPSGVICLLSALAFHEIGTQLPAEIWVAVPRGTRTPAVGQPPLRIVSSSGAAFTTGIERHRVEGATLRVYSVAKTLADLFKYRNTIGLDVALEALREAWRDHRFTMDSLDKAARACRVQQVMRPYIEAIIA